MLERTLISECLATRSDHYLISVLLEVPDIGAKRGNKPYQRLCKRGQRTYRPSLYWWRLHDEHHGQLFRQETERALNSVSTMSDAVLQLYNAAVQRGKGYFSPASGSAPTRDYRTLKERIATTEDIAERRKLAAEIRSTERIVLYGNRALRRNAIMGNLARGRWGKGSLLRRPQNQVAFFVRQDPQGVIGSQRTFNRNEMSSMITAHLISLFNPKVASTCDLPQWCLQRFEPEDIPNITYHTVSGAISKLRRGRAQVQTGS